MLGADSFQYQNRLVIHQPTQHPHMHSHALTNAHTRRAETQNLCEHHSSNQLRANTINIQFHRPVFSAVELKSNEDL